MEAKTQQLRKIALRLEPNGTAVPLSSTKLYQGGYGFIGLQVYVPMTQNRAGESAPSCTVHRTVIDQAGRRKQFNQDKYNLVYIEDVALGDVQYMLFENPLPAAFTEAAGEMEIVIDYSELKDGKVATRLMTGVYRTKVEESHVSRGETITDLTGHELALIAANTTAIETLVSDVENLLQPPDVSEADNVGVPSVTITGDGNLKFTNLKGKTGETGAAAEITMNVRGLPEGEQPTVEKGGTNEQPVFTIGIPKGDTGKTGDTGDRGAPFSVKKVYTSVSEMQANFATDMLDGELAVITTENAEDPDNAKLYVKNGAEIRYLTDMTGATGVKGEDGKPGPIGPIGPTGPIGPKGDTGADGNPGPVGPIGPKGDTGDTVDEIARDLIAQTEAKVNQCYSSGNLPTRGKPESNNEFNPFIGSSGGMWINYRNESGGANESIEIGNGTGTGSLAIVKCQRVEVNDYGNFFPIGTILTTTVDTNPASYLSGSWAQYGQGRCLVGVQSSDSDFASPKKIGGEKTHRLETGEMPGHAHFLEYPFEYTGAGASSTGPIIATTKGRHQVASTEGEGSSYAHNNLQPYITVYFWERIA